MLKIILKRISTLLLVTSILMVPKIFGETPTILKHNKVALEKILKSDKQQDEFSFVVMGDNRNGEEILSKIVTKINNDKDILFSFDNGDLVPTGFESQFKHYLKIIEPLTTPLLGVIGNHECKAFGGSSNYKKIMGKTYFSFAYSNAYFIILDDSDEDEVDKTQTDWLINELKKSQKFAHRFVLMHIPLYDPRKGDYKEGHSLDLETAKPLNDIFDKYNVTMLFTSHIHAFFKGEWHKTPFFVSGGAGAPLYGKDPNSAFYHYIKVTISKDGVKYDIVKIK